MRCARLNQLALGASGFAAKAHRLRRNPSVGKPQFFGQAYKVEEGDLKIVEDVRITDVKNRQSQRERRLVILLLELSVRNSILVFFTGVATTVF